MVVYGALDPPPLLMLLLAVAVGDSDARLPCACGGGGIEGVGGDTEGVEGETEVGALHMLSTVQNTRHVPNMYLSICMCMYI